MLGTNLVNDVPFPLVVGGASGDRYFHAYGLNGAVVWDVFLWHPDLHCPMYEVRATLPAVQGAWEAGGGSLVYTAAEDSFDLTLAPTPESNDTEIVVQVGDTTIRCNEEGLQTGGGGVFTSVVENCFFAFRIDPGGGVAIGGGAPPPGMALVAIP